MKAIRIHGFGGLDELRYEEVPAPSPGPGEAVVEVRAAALNHLDIWVRSGAVRPPLPHILGSDGAGVVAALGPGASGVAVGDEVVIDPGVHCGRCDFCVAGEHSECVKFHMIGEHVAGTFAEHVKVPDYACHPKPAAFSWEEAAAFPLVFLTAWRMLTTRARLAAHETVLIVGVGAGVSTAALAIAKAIGARAIVTSRSEAKVARARELGADEGIVDGKQEIVAEVRRLTEGRGVDVVVDSVGKATWNASLRSLRKGGRLVTCGATTGGDPPAEIQRVFWNQLSILGSTMGNGREMREVLRLAERGRLRPVVDSVYPLAEARAAQTKIEKGEQLGKVVLRVR